MLRLDKERIDWKKVNNLLPVVVQDIDTCQALMLGYMNPEALDRTLQTRRITFFSRSKGRLWTKGETSGRFLQAVELALDCDNDALLAYVRPIGPTCHTGKTSCFFAATQTPPPIFFAQLEKSLRERKTASPETSYTAKLYQSGAKRIAQKVGEEGVEVALAATAGDAQELISEAADLVYHLTVLLANADVAWADVYAALKERHKA